MNQEEFWSLVETSRQAAGGDCEAQAVALRTALLKGGKDQIVAFANHLNGRISELMSFDLLAASFIIQSYTSDDAFADFQAWLVMQGRERFEAALKDVSSFAQWLKREDVEGIDGSVFVTLAATAYQEAGGKEDEFYDRVAFPDEVDFEIVWPEDKSGFESRWPALYRKFWNQERVNELHQE